MTTSTPTNSTQGEPDRPQIEALPDAVLPSQLTSAFKLSASLQPEKRLMLAVLEDAVVTYMRHAATDVHRQPAEYREAEDWIESAEEQWPFSFVNICRALGLEVSFVRRGLCEWRRRQLLLAPDRRARVRSPFRRMNGTRTKARSAAPGLRLVG